MCNGIISKECVLVGMPVCSKRQWVVSRIPTLCCRTKRQQQFVTTLGWWGGIFCLAELYVHINDYEIERDAQVIRSDLFYSFALAHTFEVFLLFPPNFPVFILLSSSYWKFVGSYDNKLLFIVSWWYKELIVVKIHEIWKRWNVLVIL